MRKIVIWVDRGRAARALGAGRIRTLCALDEGSARLRGGTEADWDEGQALRGEGTRAREGTNGNGGVKDVSV